MIFANIRIELIQNSKDSACYPWPPFGIVLQLYAYGGPRSFYQPNIVYKAYFVISYTFKLKLFNLECHFIGVATFIVTVDPSSAVITIEPALAETALSNLVASVKTKQECEKAPAVIGFLSNKNLTAVPSGV